METIQLTSENLKTIKSLIQQFKEIDGDEDKSLELEDFYDLASIGRNLNLILEPAIKNSND